MIQNAHTPRSQNNFSPTLVVCNYYKAYGTPICDIDGNKNYIFYFRPTSNSDDLYTGYINNNVIYQINHQDYPIADIQNGQFIIPYNNGFTTIYEI